MNCPKCGSVTRSLALFTSVVQHCDACDSPGAASVPQASGRWRYACPSAYDPHASSIRALCDTGWSRPPGRALAGDCTVRFLVWVEDGAPKHVLEYQKVDGSWSYWATYGELLDVTLLNHPSFLHPREWDDWTE